MTQENLINASSIPYSIVRSTQFFEFVGGIAQSATEGKSARLPSALMQPIASDDVAAASADVAVEKPVNGTIELAGWEPNRMDDLVRRFFRASDDERQVTTDDRAHYFGVKVNDHSLVPGAHPRIGPPRFEDWLSSSRLISAH
jgi:uncharacterized protein YbjT (DUF2867 family)